MITVAGDMEPIFLEIARLLREHKTALVEVVAYRKPRSISQLRTVHMWFAEIADETGHTREEIKEALKVTLGLEVVVVMGGVEVAVRKSIADYTRAELSEFMERVQMWAAEFGLSLTQPEPEQVRAWRREIEHEESNAAGL